MLAGGLLYTAGAISYHRRRPDPYPSVFGYHEVFHAYICAAATCHFIAIALLVGWADRNPVAAAMSPLAW
jgi:hemolysin III